MYIIYKYFLETLSFNKLPKEIQSENILIRNKNKPNCHKHFGHKIKCFQTTKPFSLVSIEQTSRKVYR